MNPNRLTLRGNYIRLEPLDTTHIAPLVEARRDDSGLYAWSFVPQGEDAVRAYVEHALALRDRGKALPFVTIRQRDDTVIGTTRFFDLERWAWPEAVRDDAVFDTCEIGYTWLAPAAIRTAANTEAKALMLAHAFDTWRVRAVTFHTDARNARSRAAIERIGAKFEGILRSHRLAIDLQPRDSARYSIIASEWPDVRAHLATFLA
ncbi:MAG TPA: GNAT family protein [Verrucomicrobiae bacterium]|nr:GNAT family protein [Verrucomicrobiae bacterium]